MGGHFTRPTLKDLPNSPALDLAINIVAAHTTQYFTGKLTVSPSSYHLCFWVRCSIGLDSNFVCLARVNLVSCHCSYFVLNVRANFGDVVLRLSHFSALLVKSCSYTVPTALEVNSTHVKKWPIFVHFFNGSTPRLCEDQTLCVDYSLVEKEIHNIFIHQTKIVE